MKKIALAALAAASLGALAAPAAAQTYDRRDHDGRYDSQHDRRYESRQDGARWQHWGRGEYNINQRQRQLDAYIDAGVRRGSLTRREARSLRAEFREIARLEAQYRHNGLNYRERADLDRRFDRLEARIQHDRRDRDRRDYGYNRY